MALDTLKVELLSPRKVVSKAEATAVTIPGLLGYMKLLPGHAPLIAELGVGELSVEKRDGWEKYFVSGGFLEIEENSVKLLVDVIERPTEIDKERVLRSKARADGRLTSKENAVDISRALDAAKRADARLAFLESVANQRMA